MSNRVQAGDIAVIVRSASAENVGVLVEVLRPADAAEWFPDITHKAMGNCPEASDAWVVKTLGRPLAWPCAVGTHYFMERVFATYCLKPLRDDSGEDQTIAWAGLPGELHAIVEG